MFCSIKVFSSVLQAGRGRFCVSHKTKVSCTFFSHIIIPPESKTPVFRQTLAFSKLVCLAGTHFCFKMVSRRLLSKCTAFSCEHVSLITDNLLTCKKCEGGQKERGAEGRELCWGQWPFSSSTGRADGSLWFLRWPCRNEQWLISFWSLLEAPQGALLPTCVCHPETAPSWDGPPWLHQLHLIFPNLISERGKC